MKLLKSLILATIVGSSAASYASNESIVSSDNIQWGLLNPARGSESPQAFNLWGNRSQNTATGMLVKFKKGFASPPHGHNISYRAIVIDGQIYNGDPNATKLWMPTASYWTQPAGQAHVTAANAEDNLIYLEIDSGPYLVSDTDESFDNGERPINVFSNNLVWVESALLDYVYKSGVKQAFLWGNPEKKNGSLLKLPANFSCEIASTGVFKGVVINGEIKYTPIKIEEPKMLKAGSYFGVEYNATHYIKTDKEAILYINADTKFTIE